jgi:ribosomal protein S18 acetylase RimI-like enzyme
LWLVAVSVRLEPMTQHEYDAFALTAEGNYAADIARSGTRPEQEAREKAAADFARLLPEGLQTPDHLLLTAYDGDQPVGSLWLHLQSTSVGPEAFIYDIEVREDLRRRGYGRALMAAAEQLWRDRGIVSVGLNVFGDNAAARSLYEQMGFEVTSVQMRKRLLPRA